MRLPLVAFFETSFGRIYDKNFILVSLEGGGGEGLGECVADVDPYYSPETNVTAWHTIKDFLAPLGAQHREILLSQLGQIFESYEREDLVTNLQSLNGNSAGEA